MSTFVPGAVFAIIECVRTILGGEAEQTFVRRAAAGVRRRRPAPAHRLVVLGPAGVAARGPAAHRLGVRAGRTNTGLLLGRQADRRTVPALRHALAEGLLTMTVGTDQCCCARLGFSDALGAPELERACVEIDADLHRPGRAQAGAGTLRTRPRDG